MTEYGMGEAVDDRMQRRGVHVSISKEFCTEQMYTNDHKSIDNTTSRPASIYLENFFR